MADVLSDAGVLAEHQTDYESHHNHTADAPQESASTSNRGDHEDAQSQNTQPDTRAQPTSTSGDATIAPEVNNRDFCLFACAKQVRPQRSSEGELLPCRLLQAICGRVPLGA